ncbi:Sodium-dependent phosphate transport protein 2B [Seminavis robusta]|uniref:Sodium-dependent phosphate transport protein 2B n=1 Tax=Seminavis robusta TaxID=568900 RepID=A0A9N8EBH2_9STRA|nr:Sodium-dependent phosphate transport protein 2B [Seminavis robusta]|eukprot:Sro709_g190880.1 Sodium-dependent phosphate transport protein 2B (586) ;mRNA; f:29746-31695
MADNNTPITEPLKKEEENKGSVHYGDADFDAEVVMDATWGEVCQICCVHTGEEWLKIGLGVGLICFFLYFFLFGLELLGNSAKVMGGCRAGELFGDETNPIAGLMVGILATVLLQSSSTTTSIVVSLIGSAISVQQGIYMIMGANIGTSVTNTIVAMGQMGDGDQLERAFAGATVHDLFNFLSVIILLPVEVVTGYLNHLTAAMVKGAETEKGDKWEGPVKKLVSPLGKKVIIANKKLIKDVANGVQDCKDYYPLKCEDGVVSYKTCDTGLISCDKKTNDCPAFFDVDASQSDDQVAGGVCFFISIVILFVCLIGLVAILQKMLLGVSTRIIYKATNVNGYLGILIGAGITIIVQSSSITTSALTPLVGVGVLRLEQMLPLTLGANIGTTMTALMAAMVTEGTGALQVALAHLFFNITGIIIWYPIPFMRRVPLAGARALGRGTRLWRGFPVLYIFVVFVVIPAIFLGLSALYEQGTKGWTTLGVFFTLVLIGSLLYLGFWCKFREGRRRMGDCFRLRERRRETMDTLPDDMEFLKARVSALIDHTGMPDEEAEVPVVTDDESPMEKMDSARFSSSDDIDNEIQT